MVSGKLHEAFQSGDVNEIDFCDFSNLTRCTSDATRLGYQVDDEGSMQWYSLADPESRQTMYQSLLTGNPFGVECTGSIDQRNISIFALQMDCTSQVPEDCDLDGFGNGADVICVLILGEEGRDEWVDSLQSALSDDYVFHDGLYADAEDIGHCLTVFISSDLSDVLSNAQSGVAEYSSGVTFWLVTTL